MTRQRARGLTLEIARRMYMRQHGNLRGFGKIAVNYRNSEYSPNVLRFGGYKGIFNEPLMKELMQMVGM